jgi:hypothetical protein
MFDKSLMAFYTSGSQKNTNYSFAFRHPVDLKVK